MLGCRLEHLATCKEDPSSFDLLCEAIVRITLGHVPNEILHALRTCEVVAQDKDNGEVRPLLLSATVRRLGLRALVRIRKDQLREAAGKTQYGVGRKQGAQLLQKKLEAQAELRPDATIIKIDIKAAFQNVKRSKAVQAVALALPEVADVIKTWYQGQSRHL